MKTQTLAAKHRALAHATPVQRKRARQDGSPAVASRTRVEHAPAMCERCHAIYEHKKWRASVRTLRTAPAGMTWTLCPACAQVEDQEYFGRLLITRPLAQDREIEVRRRIWNVERRARYTQPQRRMVRIERRTGGLEILTTSEKLAHRMARELEKAFGGQAHYTWTDRERTLEATWDPEA